MTEAETARMKARIRKDSRVRIKSLSPEQRHRASLCAADNLFCHSSWQNSRNLLIYLAMENELNTAPVIHEAFLSGKNVYVPRVSQREMDFILIGSLNESFSVGNFGIREPKGSTSWTADSPEPSLLIVPGLAFDHSGRRLGRGGGYYDRFICALKESSGKVAASTVHCTGFAFDEQIIHQVPVDSRDQALNVLITDQRIMDFS